MAAQILSAERLRELVHYEPETGALYWRVARQRINVGDEAGVLNAAGYRVVRVDGALYRAHRLVWLHVHGEWPSHQIDHRNNVRHDNRIVNLRDVEQSTNQRNRSNVRGDSQSGIMGVSWDKRRQKWRVRIAIGGKHQHVGYFEDARAASSAYAERKRVLHIDAIG